VNVWSDDVRPGGLAGVLVGAFLAAAAAGLARVESVLLDADNCFLPPGKQTHPAIVFAGGPLDAGRATLRKRGG
jgi:hypothetical protein